MFLNAHSWFSLRYGTLSPEKLADIAVSQGIKALAMTDINNTSCAFQFIQACEKNGVKPILGIEFRRENKLLYIGIARNVNGWAGLCRLLSEASIDDIDLPACAPEIPDTCFIYRTFPKEIITFRSDEFYGIRPEEVNTLYASPLRKHMDRLVAFAPLTFADEDGWKVHKLLRCIDLNILLTKLVQKVSQQCQSYTKIKF